MSDAAEESFVHHSHLKSSFETCRLREESCRYMTEILSALWFVEALGSISGTHLRRNSLYRHCKWLDLPFSNFINY